MHTTLWHVVKCALFSQYRALTIHYMSDNPCTFDLNIQHKAVIYIDILKTRPSNMVFVKKWIELPCCFCDHCQIVKKTLLCYYMLFNRLKA